MLEGTNSKFNMRVLQLLFDYCDGLGDLVRVIVFMALQLMQRMLFAVVRLGLGLGRIEA